MDNARDFDVVIIGAGVIGCAIALELAKLSYSTLNVDMAPAAGYGSTGNSCSIVRTHYSTWDGIAMAHEGIKAWDDWADVAEATHGEPVARYVKCGTLWLLRPDGKHERTLDYYDELGVEYERLSVADIEHRFPALSTRSFWPPSRPSSSAFYDERTATIPGAIFTPDSGYVNDPILASDNLRRAAERRGAKFAFGSTVTEIRSEHGRVTGVSLLGGSWVSARVVVNVAGPYSARINDMAGVSRLLKIQTRPLRHEVHYVPAPIGMREHDGGCHVSDADSAIYFRPAPGDRLLIGSEDPECDPRSWVANPDAYEKEVSASQWEAQVYRCARRLPSLAIPHERRGVVDLYDCSDDWIPIYDRSDLEGFYMAIGTSGNQFKNASVVGLLMGALIDACENGLDHDRDPLKVRVPATGQVLDVGFYSRTREINATSSFSVMG